MKNTSLTKLLAEFFGTLFLLAAVVGSGIMASSLAEGNDALALLGNTVATGAILTVIITVLAPISGAHINPAVTLVFLLRREISIVLAVSYMLVQIIGGILGVWLAHVMFELDVWQLATQNRSGFAQGLSEFVATFGLVAIVLGGLRTRPEWVGALVGLYISAAYWFTASTSFANPAVTIARSLSDTFTGIAPISVPAFLGAQLLGAITAFLMFYLLEKTYHSNHPATVRDDDTLE